MSTELQKENHASTGSSRVTIQSDAPKVHEDRQATVAGGETSVEDTDVPVGRPIDHTKLPNIQRIDDVIKIVYSAAIRTNVTQSNCSLPQYLEENRRTLTEFQTVLFPNDKPIDNLDILDLRAAEQLFCSSTSTLQTMEIDKSKRRTTACLKIKDCRKQLEDKITDEKFKELVQEILEELKLIYPTYADIIQMAMTDDGDAFLEFGKIILVPYTGAKIIDESEKSTGVTPPEKRGDDKLEHLKWLFDTKYDTLGKRGFLLILNWKFEGDNQLERKGTHKDVEGLQNFFGKELGFTVCIPRSSADKHDTELKLDAHDDHVTDDLTEQDLRNVIKKVKEEIEKNISQYYCFVCAIMTHGDKKDISCKNNTTFPVKELRKQFSGEHFKFFGSPKIFLVQACRGENEEKFVTAHSLVRANKDTLSYYDTKHIPISADQMFAYATTTDNVSLRESTEGSWFIQACLMVFRAKYKTDHLENMLIDVRRLVSYMYSYKDDLKNVYKEMPEVVTRLTKQLWFSKSDS